MSELSTESPMVADGHIEPPQVAEEVALQDDNPSVESDATQNQNQTPVKKKRLYSEKEMNRILSQSIERERRKFRKGQYEAQERSSNPSAGHSNESPNGSNGSEIDRLVENKINSIFQQHNEQQQKVAFQSRQKNYQSKIQDAKNKLEDFDVVVSVGDHIKNETTEALISATEHMEHPGEFIYELCKNHPDKLKKLDSLENPWAKATEIGKIAGVLSSQSKSISSAPAPISSEKQTVNQKAFSSNVSSEEKLRQHIKKLRDKRK